MINKYNLSSIRIYEDIKEKGYKGSYTLVKITARKYRSDRQHKGSKTGLGWISSVNGKVRL